MDIFLFAPGNTHWALTNSEEVMPSMVALRAAFGRCRVQAILTHLYSWWTSLVVDFLCELLVVQSEMLVQPMTLRWGIHSASPWVRKMKCLKAHNSWQEAKEHRHNLTQKCPQRGRGLVWQGHNKGTVLLLILLLLELALPKYASLTPHKCPRGGVTPQPIGSWKVSGADLFSLRRLFWTDAGRSAEPPRWAPMVFSEHWVLYLYHLMKPQCYHRDFPLHNCHFTLWRNNKCLN